MIDNKIDYCLFISEAQLLNSIELYDFHELTGGSMRLIITEYDPIYNTKVVYSADFSDKCDCKVSHKCRKSIPLIFSNN